MEIDGTDSANRRNFLKSLTLRDLASNKKEVIFVNSSSTIEQVMQTLNFHKILSVPVWFEDSKSFQGIVDMWEIMCYLAFNAYFTQGSFQTEQFGKDLPLTQPISKLLADGSSHFRAVKTYLVDKSLFDAAVALSLDVRRILVGAMWEKFDRLITQSDIVSVLNSNISSLGVIAEKTLFELGLGTKKVISVAETSSALDGYYAMYRVNSGAVAIVHPLSGVLVGTLSASDLRSITSSTIQVLLSPINNFLRAMHGYIPSPVSVESSALLSDVLKLVCEKRIHRVWVVDSNGFPQGVVSLTDILKCVVSE